MNDQLEIFYNSTQLSGTELSEHRFKNGRCNFLVLSFFESHKYDNYTTWDVQKGIGINKYPEGSIKRAVTTLTKRDFLIKLDGKENRPFVQRIGRYGALCFAWTWKKK